MINISHTFKEKIRKIQNKLKVAKKKKNKRRERSYNPPKKYIFAIQDLFHSIEKRCLKGKMRISLSCFFLVIYRKQINFLKELKISESVFLLFEMND